jgi:hypothetical protein
MKVALDTDQSFAPGCYLVCKVDENGSWNTRDEKNTVLIQTDWDFASLAKNFGWRGGDFPDATAEISEAIDFLDSSLGTIIDDPGYFQS